MAIKGVSTLRVGKLTWMDIKNPTPEIMEEVKKKYDFHELDIEDTLSPHQRPKMDEYEDYAFIILRIPYYDSRKKTVLSEEVDIFVKDNVVITIHWGSLKALTQFFDSCERDAKFRRKMMGSGSGILLYEVIDHLYASVFPILAKMERSIGKMENEVFHFNPKHDMLKEILLLKKNLIHFRRVIAPQREVVLQIEDMQLPFLTQDLEVYFDDLVDKIEKIWNSLEHHKELIDSLQDTNESIISHTTNNVIKMLTVFSVVMLPMTFVTSLYGMNVSLPGDDHPWIFFIIAGVMGSIFIVMLLFFKWRRWI